MIIIVVCVVLTLCVAVPQIRVTELVLLAQVAEMAEVAAEVAVLVHL